MVYNKQDDLYYYAHYVSENHNADAIVSVLENYIQIYLNSSDENYIISSISDSEVAVVKYEATWEMETEINDAFLSNDTTANISSIDTFRTDETPIIRVLFLYTSSALGMMTAPQQTSIKAEVYRYINEGNESFVNSNINARLQLAYLGPTTYDESQMSMDYIIAYFAGQGDGYIDEVHTLRNKYGADLCVLMINTEENLCGRAYAITANQYQAFSIIYPQYLGCGWRYSAIHELGHLVGCRHNRSYDGSSSPYQYGHGYINCVSGNAWSTIMSYENSCDIYNERILHWSNPNVYYNGVATGTTTYENNARVWNERASTVSAFRNRGDTLFYTSSNNNTLALFESIEAETRITTSGGFEVQSGQTVEMHAPTIRLTANTHIKSGATFHASTSTSGNINTYPQFEKRKTTNSIEDFPVMETNPLETTAAKILRNGELFIERDGRTYTVQGTLVR